MLVFFISYIFWILSELSLDCQTTTFFMLQLKPWQKKVGFMGFFCSRQIIQIWDKTGIFEASQKTFGPAYFVRILALIQNLSNTIKKLFSSLTQVYLNQTQKSGKLSACNVQRPRTEWAALAWWIALRLMITCVFHAGFGVGYFMSESYYRNFTHTENYYCYYHCLHYTQRFRKPNLVTHTIFP